MEKTLSLRQLDELVDLVAQPDHIPMDPELATRIKEADAAHARAREAGRPARERAAHLAEMFATRLAGTPGQTVLASDRQYLVGEGGELRRLDKPDRSKKARRRARAAAKA